MAESSTSSGMGFFSWLTLMFIGLKLTGYIDWSWWLVLSPVWVPLAVVLAVFPVGYLVCIVLVCLLNKPRASATKRKEGK